jgi:hypothetical protein
VRVIEAAKKKILPALTEKERKIGAPEIRIFGNVEKCKPKFSLAFRSGAIFLPFFG